MTKNMEKEAEEHDTEAAAEKITAAATSPAVVTTTTVWAAASLIAITASGVDMEIEVASRATWSGGDGLDQFQWRVIITILLTS